MVAVANLFDLALHRGDAVSQNLILQHEFAIVVGDAVHFRGVEDVGDDHICERNDDEANQHLSQNVVSVSSF